MTMREDRTPAPALQGPALRPLDRVRAAIEDRAQRFAARFPRALDLEARVLSVLHRRLDGFTGAVSGWHLREHFSQMLRGERSMPVGDLCRLATEGRRDARQAARAAAILIVEEIDRSDQVIDLPAPWKAHAQIARSAGELLAELAHKLRDGRLDAAEAADLEDELTATAGAIDAVKAIVAAAQAPAVPRRMMRRPLVAREARA